MCSDPNSKILIATTIQEKASAKYGILLAA